MGLWPHQLSYLLSPKIRRRPPCRFVRRAQNSGRVAEPGEWRCEWHHPHHLPPERKHLYQSRGVHFCTLINMFSFNMRFNLEHVSNMLQSTLHFRCCTCCWFTHSPQLPHKSQLNESLHTLHEIHPTYLKKLACPSSTIPRAASLPCRPQGKPWSRSQASRPRTTLNGLLREKQKNTNKNMFGFEAALDQCPVQCFDRKKNLKLLEAARISSVKTTWNSSRLTSILGIRASSSASKSAPTVYFRISR